MTNSLTIGKIAGIKIGIQPLWLVIVALITWSLGAVYYPDQVSGISPAGAYALGLASALLLFASILLHELGHAIVARRSGVEIEEIDLWLLGGVARMKGEPESAGAELRIAVAGPAVTLAVIAVLGSITLALPGSTPNALTSLVEYQLFVNSAILVFNLIPAFPLDGGRVARALIWMRTSDLTRATSIAATVGRGFGYAFIGLGLVGVLAGGFGGIWFVLIGLFVIFAASGEERHQRVQEVFSGSRAGTLMSFPAVAIPASITVAEAVDEYFARCRFTAFPVVDGDLRVGLIDIEQIETIPQAVRASVKVADATRYDAGLVVDEDSDITELLDRPIFQRVGRAVVRTEGGQFGILSATDVNRALRASSLQHPERVKTA